jgi:2-oxoglutarate dehydrogenase E2 component (dihydrolipoamide succinyltransferase)
MSTIEDHTPLGNEVPSEAAPQNETGGEQAGDVAQEAVAAEPAGEPRDTLSPAVRRLVRQFDLDITGIHGTGPEGRIRVGDVMSLLHGRTDTGNRDAPLRVDAAESTALEIETAPETPLPLPSPAATPAAAPHSALPSSSVFECDMTRVLAHRKRLRRDHNELLTTTSYVLTALASALEATPELAVDAPVRFGVWLTTPDGELRSSLVELPDPMPEPLEEQARAFDLALRANLDADLAPATLLVHAYGESGSLLVTPTPIGNGHVASVGIGRIRREVVVRVVDGVETPRVAARCYLSVSFFDDRVGFHRANRAFADTVRILENWPDSPD